MKMQNKPSRIEIGELACLSTKLGISHNALIKSISIYGFEECKRIMLGYHLNHRACNEFLFSRSLNKKKPYKSLYSIGTEIGIL